MSRSLRRGEFLLVALVVVVLAFAAWVQWRDAIPLAGLYRAAPGAPLETDLALLESGVATLRWQARDGSGAGSVPGVWRQSGDAVELRLESGPMRLRIEETADGLVLLPESGSHPALGSARLTRVMRWTEP